MKITKATNLKPVFNFDVSMKISSFAKNETTILYNIFLGTFLREGSVLLHTVDPALVQKTLENEAAIGNSPMASTPTKVGIFY